MYPFAEDVFAVRNCWYVASYSRDVSRKPLERWILDEPVVLYRRENGDPVALEGRCAHRHFPLGEGTLVGDDIQCPYHGFTYAPDGRNVRIPSQTRPSDKCAIKSFPVVEKWRWIWIWMGHPALADPALIPCHKEIGLEEEDNNSDEVLHVEVEARYQLLHDNLMDLSHVGFLHQNTLGGGSEAAAQARVVEQEGEGWLESERTLANIPMVAIFAPYVGYDGQIDRKVGQRFYLPALHHGWDKFLFPEGHPRAGELVGKLVVYHAITPARRNTTHYFFATARTFGPEAQDQMRAATTAVIDEDVWALTHLERTIRSYGDKLPPEFSARIDTQQLLARRKLEKMIRSEQPRPD